MASNNSILSINFDFVDYRQVLEAIDGYKASGRRELVTITNPHSVLMCGRDEKIRYLWDNPDLCQKMDHAGREKALREYSPEKYYQRLMAVYKKAIEPGPGGPSHH